MGFFEETMADGSIRRGQTFTCCHCNGVSEMDPTKDSAICPIEMKPCHVHCHPTVIGGCKPFEKRLERMESRDRLRRSILDR